MTAHLQVAFHIVQGQRRLKKPDADAAEDGEETQPLGRGPIRQGCIDNQMRVIACLVARPCEQPAGEADVVQPPGIGGKLEIAQIPGLSGGAGRARKRVSGVTGQISVLIVS